METNETNKLNERNLKTLKDLNRDDYLLIFLVGIISTFAISLLVGIIAGVVLAIKKYEYVSPSLQANITTYTTFATYLTAFILFLVIILIKYRHEFFNEFKKIMPYLIGLFACFAMIGFEQIYFLLYTYAPFDIVGSNQQSIALTVQQNPAIMAITTVILAPFVEELTYRVGLFNLCKTRSKLFAYIIAPLVFALIHIDFLAGQEFVKELIVLPTYLFSAYTLTYIYDKYGFSASLFAHIMNNLISVLILIYL